MHQRIAAVGLASLLVVTGCSSDAEPSDESGGRFDTADQSSTTSVGANLVESVMPGPGGGRVGRSYGSEAVPPELDGIVSAAVDDLAARLDVDTAAITVLAVEEVVWADSSYGCPGTDMAYVPGDADGMRIVLGVADTQHEYRLAGGLVPVYCDATSGLIASSVSTTTAAAPTTSTEATSTETTSTQPPPSTSTTAVPADEIDVDLVPDEEKGDEPTEGLNPPDE